MRGSVLLIQLLAIMLSVPCAAKQDPQPIISLNLSSFELQGGTILTGTPVFLSNDIIAIGLCSKLACDLQTFQFVDDHVQQIGHSSGIEHFRGLLRGPNDNIVVNGILRDSERGALILDSNLQSSRFIKKESSLSPSGEPILERPGRMLAQSDGLVAYLDESSIWIWRSDGELLGSFKSAILEAGPRPGIIFIGQDRILSTNGRTGRQEIRDFRGKLLLKIDRARGALGEKVTSSANGARLVEDSFARQVKLSQSVIDKMREIESMGMSTDDYAPNRELVRVLDSKTGRQCFEWVGKENLLPAFVDHADIDPTGRFLAIMTRQAVLIFRLPEVCGVN